MTAQNTVSILVMGIGNVLWADEGFGVRAVETFNALYDCPETVSVVDGGTQGLYLLPHVEACDALILFDAIDYGLPSGTLKVICDDEVPAFMGAKKMSLHQTGFQEVLATAELLGWKPRRRVLIGVQPAEIDDYGGSLRPIVDSAIEPAIAVAVEELKALGATVTRRRASVEALGPDALDRALYETERPSAAEACRIGDPRFLDIQAGD
ncbi:HyaD/HybD family hydrogenase maturation endopeptidase [Asticcacaulis sp. 201]|uniref:HyaD/HybD family hydrogenase maturation endopeptidase n=1 Tax=Asticcacaulis sp. 201 TaxID=3028787 RepID=UPI002916331C|nr:HyaD/HybD family hydrogenase maturation endopeptidase [Asticcacaulis sp. 201]MDV6330616.1 HyaD/HybD family hydrogenase maturation endopeptidase [Asticcacaulis sp. 201]